ncbi:hypothetical protein VAE055_420744 [Vibrio aestuarianus]|nr:hypothetical protein VIBAE_B10827 [Vibrio aestuarianus subsp. francensis]CAH8229260.1 hypothetical protein VAE055_420744 [Vibrio aestuarianus]CAH8236652.1 hypothetical protein VAE142_930741 [Vibrio aestuarianus]
MYFIISSLLLTKFSTKKRQCVIIFYKDLSHQVNLGVVAI